MLTILHGAEQLIRRLGLEILGTAWGKHRIGLIAVLLPPFRELLLGHRLVFGVLPTRSAGLHGPE